MIDDEHDEATYGKILAAAEEIQAMARNSPAQAAAMFEQARHLLELAEQIRNDWLRRGGRGARGRRSTPQPGRQICGGRGRRRGGGEEGGRTRGPAPRPRARPAALRRRSGARRGAPASAPPRRRKSRRASRRTR